MEHVARNPLFPVFAFEYTFILGQLRMPVISYSHTRWALLGVLERFIVGGEFFCVRASSFVGMAELRGCFVAWGSSTCIAWGKFVWEHGLDRCVVFVPGTGAGTWIEEVRGEVWEGRCDVCEVWGAGTGAKPGMGGV